MDWSVRKTHFHKLVAIEFAPQLAKFFTCKWKYFAISTFVITEEMASARPTYIW